MRRWSASLGAALLVAGLTGVDAAVVGVIGRTRPWRRHWGPTRRWANPPVVGVTGSRSAGSRSHGVDAAVVGVTGGRPLRWTNSAGGRPHRGPTRGWTNASVGRRHWGPLCWWPASRGPTRRWSASPGGRAGAGVTGGRPVGGRMRRWVGVTGRTRRWRRYWGPTRGWANASVGRRHRADAPVAASLGPTRGWAKCAGGGVTGGRPVGGRIRRWPTSPGADPSVDGSPAATRRPTRPGTTRPCPPGPIQPSSWVSAASTSSRVMPRR